MNEIEIAKNMTFHTLRLDYYQRIVENWVAILKGLNIHDKLDILDLCPGWAPKVEMALAELQYRGLVRVLDKNPNHLDLLEESFRFFFDAPLLLEKVSADLLQSRELPTSDITIANHIIDDVLVNTFFKGEENDLIDLYLDGDRFCNIWEQIAADKVFLDQTITLLSSVFARLVREQGYLVIAQYPGHIETEFCLKPSIESCQYVLSGVVNQLVELGWSLEQGMLDQIYEDLDYSYIPRSGVFCFSRTSIF